MVKVNEFELPPPGAGLKTVTTAVPAAAMSLAEICAVSPFMLPLLVVGRSLPFQRTTESATKSGPTLGPITVNLLSTALTNRSPAGAQLGERALIVGTGLALDPLDAG
jgi:hypothetical protein